MKDEIALSEGQGRAVPELALKTKRAQFLGEADRLFPWKEWESMIELHYPKRRNGRPPYPLAPLLRLYLLQQWFGLSDAAAEDLATDSVAVRNFLGLPLTWDKCAPDESTIANFRRLMARRQLAPEIAADVSEHLSAQGWKMRMGSISEAGFSAVNDRLRSTEQACPDNLTPTKPTGTTGTTGTNR